MQFILLSIVWGSSFLFIKVSLGGLSPVQLVAGRVILGALALTLIMVFSRRKWITEIRLWAHLTVVALLLCVFPFLLYAWAEQYMASGLASIYNAVTPIMTLLVGALALPGERLNRWQTLGVLISALGVVCLSAPWRYLADPAAPLSFPAQLACLAAAACYGVAFVYLRRFVSNSGYDSITLAAGQLCAAAAIMVLVLAIAGGPQVQISPAVGGCMLVLGTIGTGLAYIWNTNVLAGWGAQIASMVTYVSPVVGVLLGLLILAEPLHWNEPIGGLVVIIGIVITKLIIRRPASLPAEKQLGKT